MKTSWSIKLGIVALMMMVYGWIFFPAHTLKEWEQFLLDISVFIVGVALLWFGLWRMQIIKDRAAAEEAREEARLDAIRDKVISRQEMRENAEKALTEDQKAHLRIIKTNPHLKIDIKV